MLGSATFELDENSANGTVVGTVAATDQDNPAQTLSYAIVGGNDNGAATGVFAIDESTGVITVANGAGLDYETLQSFSLVIEVSDSGTPSASSTGVVTIDIRDVNEAATVSGGPFSVDENSAGGTLVGTVIANDPDAGQSHTFAITAGNTGNAFAIDPSSGQITVADGAVLNFEATPTYTLTVSATDNGNPDALTGSGNITINLNNVNEPPTISGTTFEIAENSPEDTVVGTVTASDPDSGQTLTYSITAGNTSGAFAIDDSTGAITVADATKLDYETTPSFNLTVRVSDGLLHAEAAIVIDLIDVNEPPAPVAKSYAAHLHLTISVPASDGLLQGVVDPENDPVSVALVTDEETQVSDPPGATITINPDGSFEFTSPHLVGGDVTFKYTLCDNKPACSIGTAKVTVTMSSPRILFVDSKISGEESGKEPGNGTLARPFKYLASALPGGRQSYDIFLYEGTYGDEAPQNIEFANNVRLIGQGYSDPEASFDTEFGLTSIPAFTVARPTLHPTVSGTRPTINGTVDLGAHVATVKGVKINNSSTATALKANGAEKTITVLNTEVESTGAAIELTGSSGVVSLVKTTSSGGTNNVKLTNVTATVALGGGSLTNSTGAAFYVSGGKADISYSGSISNNANRSVDITAKTGGTVSLSGAITSNGGRGISLSSNTGATINFSGALTLNTGAFPAFTATGGGTVTATNAANAANTLTTTTATALNVANTTIGSGGLVFRSISANGAPNGIVLNNTGNTAGLTVSGTGGAGSGGTIKNTTGHGISLASTKSPSFTSMNIQNTAGDGISLTATENPFFQSINIQDTAGHGIRLASTKSPSFTSMNIQNTAGSGIRGTGVTNFTLMNSTINNSGTNDVADESNVAFFTSNPTGVENNLDGTVTITGNTLTNARWHGVYIQNFSGMITNADISNNTITSSTALANSKGNGIGMLLYGSASTAASLTKGTISNNIITNFPSDGGILVQGGNANSVGPAGNIGVLGDVTNKLDITGNTVSGQSATNPMGTHAILVSVSGRGQGNVFITNNGMGTPLRYTKGHTVGVGMNGNTATTATTASNVIESHNDLGSNGISGGTGITFDASDTPSGTWVINNNTISQTDGNGILAFARGATGSLRTRITDNLVAAPLGSVRPGIRVDAGNASSLDDLVCLDIRDNTSAGSGGHPGIGLRKQGSASNTNDFGIVGMSATTSPGVEAYVSGLNPAGNGTLLISATAGFTSCNF